VLVVGGESGAPDRGAWDENGDWDVDVVGHGVRHVNSFARRSRRSVAAILGLSLLCFEPALADDPGAADEPVPAPAPASSAAPAAPSAAAPAAPAAAAPTPPAAAGPNRWADGAVKAFDVIPIRLLSTCSVIVGFGAFIVAAPLVAPGFQMEGIRNSWDYFVMAPVDYTFVRPLGDF